MAENAKPFREDESKVLVSAEILHKESTRIEPEWSGDRGDDYGDEVWFDLRTGSFRRQQTHKKLSYDINTGKDTSWYYPDRVDAREYSILDLPSMGFDIDSIDDGVPWCVAGPIADYLRNPIPLQAVESLTAIYRSRMGRDYTGHSGYTIRSMLAEGRCILPNSCALRLSERILDDFASGPDDGSTAEEATVSQALEKLGAREAGDLAGETRSVAKSIQEVMASFYPRGVGGLVSANDESDKIPDWYCPETGQYVMHVLWSVADSQDTFKVTFEAYKLPLSELAEEMRRYPGGTVGSYVYNFCSWDRDLRLDDYFSIRNAAKRIATEDGWIRVDQDWTMGEMASRALGGRRDSPAPRADAIAERVASEGAAASPDPVPPVEYHGISELLEVDCLTLRASLIDAGAPLGEAQEIASLLMADVEGRPAAAREFLASLAEGALERRSLGPEALADMGREACAAMPRILYALIDDDVMQDDDLAPDPLELALASVDYHAAGIDTEILPIVEGEDGSWSFGELYQGVGEVAADLGPEGVYAGTDPDIIMTVDGDVVIGGSILDGRVEVTCRAVDATAAREYEDLGDEAVDPAHAMERARAIWEASTRLGAPIARHDPLAEPGAGRPETARQPGKMKL